MKIAIITRGREGAQLTLRNLPPELRANAAVVCPKGEHHGDGVEHIYEPNDEPMNYSQKFQWTIRGAGGAITDKKIMVMDDDLRFCMMGPTPGKLLPATPEKIVESYLLIKEKLDVFPLVGVHPRAMGQNNFGIQSKSIARINAIHAINRDFTDDIQVDQFPILADMVLNLSLLTRGLPNLVLCELMWDQVGTSNAPGGCSIHRTWEQQRDSVMGLKTMFPDFVTVKQKVTKAGWWGPDKPRYDFVVQWKKAYDHGTK